MTFSEGDGGRFPLAPIQGHWSPENDFLSKGQNGSVRLPGWRAVFGFPGRQPARPAAVTGGSHSTSRSAPSPPCPPQHGRAAANSQPASQPWSPALSAAHGLGCQDESPRDAYPRPLHSAPEILQGEPSRALLSASTAQAARDHGLGLGPPGLSAEQTAPCSAKGLRADSFGGGGV